jgi:hypothetical protein
MYFISYGPPAPALEGSKVDPDTPEPLNVPPAVVGAIVTIPPFSQIVAGKPVNVGSIDGATVTFRVLESVHPAEVTMYFISYGPPTPATEGSKVDPDTPEPLNVPPAVVGVIVTIPPFSQIVAGKPVKVASGDGFTVMWLLDVMMSLPPALVAVSSTSKEPAVA